MRVALGGSALVVRRERGVRVALEAHPSKRRARVHPVARRLDGEREGIVGGGERRGHRRRRRRRGPARARATTTKTRATTTRTTGGPSVVGGTAGCLAARAPASAPNGSRADARSAPSASARASPSPTEPARPRLDEARGRGVCTPREGGARAKETKSNLCSAAATQARDEEAPLLPRGALRTRTRTGPDSTREQTPNRFRFVRFRAGESHRSSKQTSVSSVRFRPGESGSVRHRSASFLEAPDRNLARKYLPIEACTF